MHLCRFVHVFEDADDAEHGSGIDAFAQSLVIETDVAPVMGISNSSQALVMPSMVWENCHMMCGFSGFPKLRQLVAATGVAPEQATLRAASATACMAPRRGSR